MPLRSSKAMNVVLFEAFPDPYRQSMARYASCLKSALTPLLRPGELILSYLPPVRVAPKAARYWSEYVIYPWMARRQAGEVNHIIDHAYGHLAGWIEPKRTVVTVHDMIALKTRDGFIRRHNLRGICRAAHVICVSEATRQEFLRLSGYPPEQTHVIHEGVEEEFFVEPAGDPFERLGLPRARYLLHIGHVFPYKNIPGLLRVFSQLVGDKGTDLFLLRVGGAFTREQQRLAQQLGIAGRIRHLGYVPSKQLPLLYRCAELLLFPSLDEGFGFPVLEAMASSLPVVASQRGALPEVAGQAALLADPSDPTALVDRVRNLLKDSALRFQLKEAGRRRARQFTWDSTARKTLEIYHRVHEAAANR